MAAEELFVSFVIVSLSFFQNEAATWLWLKWFKVPCRNLTCLQLQNISSQKTFSKSAQIRVRNPWEKLNEAFPGPVLIVLEVSNAVLRLCAHSSTHPSIAFCMAVSIIPRLVKMCRAVDVCERFSLETPWIRELLASFASFWRWSRTFRSSDVTMSTSVKSGSTANCSGNAVMFNL